MVEEFREVNWPPFAVKTRWAVWMRDWPDPLGIYRWRWYARYVAWVCGGDCYVVPWAVPK